MGASVGGGGGARRRGRRQSRHGAISEINVTPLVDVMLVLLIVFMVAAPLMTVGVPVELPKTSAKAMSPSTDPLYVSVQADGKVYLQETEISVEELAPKLLALGKNGNEEQVQVRADQGVNYGRVAEILGVLNGAGFNKVGMVTLTKDVPAN